MVDRLRRTEIDVVGLALLLLSLTMVASVLQWNALTPVVLVAFVIAGLGSYYLHEVLFVSAAGVVLLGGALVVQGPVVILLIGLCSYAALAGGQAIELLKENADCTMTDPKELPRKYLGSLLFLALEFFVGGVLTLLIVIASPLWHYPSWTVVELGLVSVAVLATITYWLLRSRDEAQKA